MQYLLFYAEIIDKNGKNRAYADLGHISGVLHDSNSFITIVVEGDGRGNGVHGSLFQDRSHLLRI